MIFNWANNVPLVGSSGTMGLGERDDSTIALRAVSGAMAGGQWRFRTETLADRSTGVLGWARFDVARANFLIQAIVDADVRLPPRP